MFQADVANRICRPTCERFLASVDRELDGAARQDQATLRLCRALFTRADEIGATYRELFASAVMAALEVAYKTGHRAEDIIDMLRPKLDELTAQRSCAVHTASSSELTSFVRKGSMTDPRALVLFKTLLGDGIRPPPSVLDVLHAAANTLLLVVRDTAMSADAATFALRRFANENYAC